jgi:hypothetical protein
VVQCLKPIRSAVKVACPLASVLQPGVPLLRVSCRFVNVHIELLISFLDMLMYFCATGLSFDITEFSRCSELGLNIASTDVSVASVLLSIFNVMQPVCVCVT